MPVTPVLLIFTTALAAGLSIALEVTAAQLGKPEAKTAAFSLPRDPVADTNRARNETTHITLVLVGDTGYAPHGMRPQAKGVSKHGSWQTWDQTTRRIRTQINGDINFANIETVISDNGGLRRRPKAFTFMTHPNGARHLVDTGFNLFSMANNHAFDFGAGGIRDSVRHADNLKANGLLAHAGIGLNRTQAAHVPVFSKKDTRFAFGAIGIGATYGGLPRASNSRPGQLGINNKSDVLLLMNNLRRAQADYRMLSIHRGYEKIIRVDGSEISNIRNAMLEQGNIDLLIGHHAHVTRGVEMNKGRLVFYGLGNFLHPGTANMAVKGRCKDYSILARVHLVRRGQEKPQLAAVEIVPIVETHKRPRPMKPRQAAKRVAVLNGLARQFDNPARGAKGVRFSIRGDGTGLYCTSAAENNEATSSLCLDYDEGQASKPRVFRAALATCGGSYSPVLIARRSKPKINRVGKPSSRPNIQLVSLQKEPAKQVVVQSPVSKPKRTTIAASQGKPVFDAGLLRPDFRTMTKAEIKTYWTLVWYKRHGRTPPPELTQLAIAGQKQAASVSKAELAAAWDVLRPTKIEEASSLTTPESKSGTQKELAEAWTTLGSGNGKAVKSKPEVTAALSAAWKALGPKKAPKTTIVVKPETKPDLKIGLAAAWEALASKKAPPAKPAAKLAEKTYRVANLEEAPAAVQTAIKRKIPQKLIRQPAKKVIYDAGLKRPDLATMSKAEVKSYWTRVWYAKRGQKPPEEEVQVSVLEQKPEPLPEVVKPEVELPAAKPELVVTKPDAKVTYDSGLRRPDFNSLTKKQITAYWTRVWYARHDLKRK